MATVHPGDDDPMMQASNLSDLMESLDASPAAAYIKNLNGVIQYVNSACARLLGSSSPSDFVGKTDHEIFSPETAAIVTRQDREVMLTGKAQNFETVIKSPGRDCVVRSIKTPLRAANGEPTGVIGLVVEITDERAEQDRLKSLLHTCVEQFVEDLKEPLQAIEFRIRLLQTLDSEELRAVMFEGLRRDCRHMDDLLEALAAKYRLEAKASASLKQ